MQELKSISKLLNLLQAGCRRKDFTQGRLVYSAVVEDSLESTAVLADYFIRLLAIHGYVKDSEKAFSYVSKPSVYTWTARISAHAAAGNALIAIDLAFNMQKLGAEPDRVILLCVLNCCASARLLHHGRLFHHQVLYSEFVLDVVIKNTIVDMYAKCGSLQDAHSLFHILPDRTLVSWSALIAGYAHNGYDEVAYDLFICMLAEGFHPSRGMFLCILKVCSCMEDSEKCMIIYDQVIRHGLECDILITSSLIDMYSKCDCLTEAYKILMMLPNPNIVSWGAMINGYAYNGEGDQALDLFEQIQKKGFKPDKFLYSSMIKLCANMGASEQGEILHKKASRSGYSKDTAVGNALIDMYCKCGNLLEAHKVFDELPVKDVVSWGALIAGYALHGAYGQAIKCLENMKKQGFKPDSGIFLNILTACSHSGLMDKGWGLFKVMVTEYKVKPSLEHYNCIINLFSKAGHMNEAADLLHAISEEPDNIGWRSLLAGAQNFKKSEVRRGLLL
ncbi:hypothetical protein KP509_07G081900 [Ceratopteris richardii]|uniref:Pentatricopeptide repeat-containing protein n=1 Tax=Ceratopteris richardii TaxID=49495 RepID=A0A8T2UCL2_CERRI|nr:hypothetical protein KP509_07G081900 [Ceratopteris richardii]